MLDRIHIKNFKAFNEADITIKPITVIVGPNSSGKSSLIQAITLVQQTLLRNANNDAINIGSSINSSDQIIDLGSFSNIVNQSAAEKRIEFKLYFSKNYVEFSLKEDKNAIVYVDNFILNAGNIEYSLTDLSPEDYNKKDFNIKYIGNLRVKLSDEIKNKNSILSLDVKPKIYREGFFFLITSVKPDEDSLKVFIDEQFSKQMRSDINSEEDKNSVNKIINAFLNYIDLYNKVSTSSYSFYQKIRKDFSNINYIGPIRQMAERYYSVGTFQDLGYRGEHAIQILAQDTDLKMKVEKYFKKMNIAQSLEVNQKPRGRNFEIKIKTQCTEKGVNYKDVGCGTSQILPIIVQSLMVKEEALTILEQPEVHLHPKTQAELADFFKEIASENNRFLIETHSDYFIERLRYHVATGDLRSEDVIIYYIDFDPATKSSKPFKIEINSKGQYHNLPQGYITNFRLDETKNMANILIKNLSEEYN